MEAAPVDEPEEAADIVFALNELDRQVAEGLLGPERGGYARAKLLALKRAAEAARQAEEAAAQQALLLEERLRSDNAAALNAEEGVELIETRLQEEVERAETEANKTRDRVEAVVGEARACAAPPRIRGRGGMWGEEQAAAAHGASCPGSISALTLAQLTRAT